MGWGDVSLELTFESAGTQPEAAVRLPLEHALALDRICAQWSSEDRVYVVTESSVLLQAIVDRHDRLVVHEAARAETLAHDGQPIETVDGPEAVDGQAVDRALVLEPGTPNVVRRTVEAIGGGCPHNCLVGNPYSFNRVEDRSVEELLSPRRVRGVYEAAGFRTELVGYHGPRSILQSVRGRASQALGRPDRRDVYTHRMRAAYRESLLPLALLSCLVHVEAIPQRGRT
jgi:hypothetical protein